MVSRMRAASSVSAFVCRHDSEEFPDTFLQSRNQDLATYRDQTDSFFDSPHNYLQTCFPSEVDPLFSPSPFPTSIPGVTTPSLSGPDAYPWAHEWPQYLVFFGSLLQQEGVRELLEQRGFREVWKKGREWEGEGHRKGGVRVWKWSG